MNWCCSCNIPCLTFGGEVATVVDHIRKPLLCSARPGDFYWFLLSLLAFSFLSGLLLHSFCYNFFHFGDDIFHFYKFSCFLAQFILWSFPNFSLILCSYSELFSGCFLFLPYGVHIGQLPSSLPGLIPTSMPFPVMVFATGFHNFAASHAGGVYNLMNICIC